jgi:hypothetical protein
MTQKNRADRIGAADGDRGSRCASQDESEFRSFGSPLLSVQFVEHPANLRSLLGCRRLSTERTHDESFGRTPKYPLQKIASNTHLHLAFWGRWLIDVRSKAFAADQQSLFGHQAHLRKRGVVIAIFL